MTEDGFNILSLSPIISTLLIVLYLNSNIEHLKNENIQMFLMLVDSHFFDFFQEKKSISLV